MVAEGALLWTPSEAFQSRSRVRHYMDWLRQHRNLDFQDYESLRRWSVAEIEAFWGSLWDYFEVISDRPYRQVLDRRVMPGAKWFEGARINYAEHQLRHEAADPERVVFHHQTETRPLATLTWGELGRQVRIVATQLRALGVGAGDRVVAYMPNAPETAVAMLATIAIGAVWSSAAPEFGVKTVIDRFSQVEPKLLFAADGYRFGGKAFARATEVRNIAGALPSLEAVIWLPFLDPQAAVPDGLPKARSWASLLDHPEVPRAAFRFERVAHDHPIWIVFSSGTTGLPKPIVHGHAGALIEHLKVMSFHFNFTPDSVMFFYTTTGWMMWNLLLASLLTGSTAVLYDGNPGYPGIDFLWRLASAAGATSFGASPTFVQMMEKAGLKPGEVFDLSRLESVVVAGAPSTPETFDWFYRCVKKDLWVTSQSGGTELCSGFVGACPLLPVYAGEIQTRMLGMDVQAWSDDGRALTGEVGELVCASPFPSMPVRFWNDPEDRRYRESYFEVFPGVWRHGDFIKINARGGCYIYGRSDSTLNRYGVRIGTAEIYRAVEQVEGVADSLIVCCELPGGHFFMPMFLRLKPGAVLDPALTKAVAARLREDCSPRHVPDKLYAVEAIPYTLTGKKMEVPVRKILMGWPLEKAANRDAMANPESIDWFVRYAAESTDYQWRSKEGNTA